MKKIADALVRHCADFFAKCEKTRGVLGISGGVDSAVVAAISAQALGSHNISGFFLPHRDFSSAENLNDAKAVADFLQIPAQEREISPFCSPFFALDFANKTMTRGNIMARVRMMILYARANESNALVLGTGNKTELMTGFFTKWGDGAVDVEVLGNLWKTEVFALARYFGLPRNVWEKAPTAELFLGQTDEAELQISYADLDLALQKIEKNPENFFPQNPEEKRAFALFQKTKHKRSGIPSLEKE